MLLVSLRAERVGFWPFMALTASFTLAFAVASWWLVEKHALRLKKVNFGRPSFFRQPLLSPAVPPVSGGLAVNENPEVEVE
jgi:peptidoglycan/LPS O-acetylase OafA/YrhL